jgi:1-aminocyclopropane-1-carboxylate deaminase/D-cysteine desulfhydrase-like pyridoxal-dependent ACC family enzyme
LKIIFSCFVLVSALAFANSNVFAQKETATGVDVEKDLSLLRRDIRADKKQLIAANMSFTEAEATRFWPVYDQYVAEMTVHNDEFYALIKDYAANQKVITDAQSTTMLKRWAEVQVNQAKTRQKYVPLIEKVIPPRKAALFFQIDRRLYALLDMQVSSQVPLIVQ